ncbi:nitrate ABC transporter substrate-binding protein [Levilactobacillus spicheri]|uniref:Putative aliphatic sulfonates-binding protein n=2 Tax=Levilactobacillus spicheri TaxID=216463 RepID=A0A0F3RUX5_9LACO|nr:nitrate ABC transporter substrate-binding protein [Levilactobacillus spicheri]GEO66856.1 nitrate ABC transporter substrate-binding protein [Levilactobacillus spicheri]
MRPAKRRLLKWVITLMLVLWAGVAGYGYTQTRTDTSTSSQLTTVTIGYQKGDPVDIAKQRGELVQKMKKKGYQVVYKQFQDGSALMQALKAGSIDYARLGDSPPVSAIAAGTKLTFVAAGSSKAQGSAIVIKQSSSISSIKDLKGKKVAYTKGTASEYMLLSALKKAGMAKSDITWVNMQQSAASVAFAKGKVDAWVTWDPYTAQAQLTENGKILVTGEGLSKNRDYLVTTPSYQKKNSQVSTLLTKYLGEDMQWADTHHQQLITMLSKSLKLSKSVVKKMVERRSYTMSAVTTSEIKEEQKIADLFYQEGLIKHHVTIKKSND